MLLTFPNKDSLLRKVQDSDPAQKYLIVANYRALKDWNLIPLNEMTVLLGPNSSGKSSVFEALDGLRMLVDGIRLNSDDKRVDRHYDSQRDESSPHCIGFSAPYPTSNQSVIKGLCAQSSTAGLMRDIDIEVEENTFPILSRLVNDSEFRAHLKDTTYTFIVEELTDDDLDLSVYLDGEFAANFRVQDVFQQVTFTKKFVRLFKNDSELLVDIFNSEDEFCKIEYRVGRWQAFSASPSYVYYPVPYEPAYTTANDEIYGLIVAFFHAPINSILNSFRKKVTQDVRSLTSDWEFCRRKSAIPIENYLAQAKLNTKSSQDFPNSLISDEIDVSLGWLDSASSKLFLLNRWLKEPAFMGTPYQVEIEVKACIPITDLSESFTLRSRVKRDSLISEAGIEYLGRAYLRDSEGRFLLFSDVGAGFSQVIPILVALTSDTTILYKQPEVHLHPKLQSKVADCFIETVNRENIFKNSFRIIETHSEHFVLRLLRRVRESFGDELLHSSLTLQAADFSLVYFQPKGDHSEIHQIRVAESGEFIDSWPDGFFDERDEEIWGSSQWGGS